MFSCRSVYDVYCLLLCEAVKSGGILNKFFDEFWREPKKIQYMVMFTAAFIFITENALKLHSTV
jgi:hypothetical protein